MGAAPALAADLPVRPAPPVYKAPVVAPPGWSWTGCYIGGNVGGAWIDKDYSLTTTGADRGNHRADGIIAGAQVGCDYQFNGNWVIGIQGDYDWADAKGDHIDLGAPAIRDRSTMRSLGSVTGRIGYAFWDRFL